MKPYSKCLQKGNGHDRKTLYTNVSQSGVLIIPLAEFDFTNSRFFKLTCDCTVVNLVIYCINTSFLPLPHVQSKAEQGKGKQGERGLRKEFIEGKKCRSKDTKRGTFRKNNPLLLQVKWSVPNYNFEFVDTTEGGAFYNGTRRRMFRGMQCTKILN